VPFEAKPRPGSSSVEGSISPAFPGETRLWKQALLKAIGGIDDAIAAKAGPWGQIPRLGRPQGNPDNQRRDVEERQGKGGKRKSGLPDLNRRYPDLQSGAQPS
jgi:hypothetical protein